MSNPSSLPARWRRLTLGSLVLVGTLVTAAYAAEMVLVQRDEVKIRDRQGGSSAKVVATVPAGTQLEVLQRDGKWLKVKTSAGEGWVLENALTPRSTTTTNQMEQIVSGAGTADAEAGAASKGLDAEEYAQAHGYDMHGLDLMEAMRSQISAEQLAAFQKEGGVGPLGKGGAR